MPRPTVRRRYHHGNLRTALIEAAAELLATKGMAGVTLRGVARRAGVSQAAPYRHFADKEALLAAVAEDSFRALTETLERAVGAAPEDPVERLLAMAGAYAGFAAEHPARYRLMWTSPPRGSVHHGLRAAAGAGGEQMHRVLAACADAGKLRRGHTLEFLFVLWSLLHGVSALSIEEQLPREIRDRVPADALARRAAAVLMDGLRARD